MLFIVPTYECNLRCKYCYEKPLQEDESCRKEYIDASKFYGDMVDYFTYIRDNRDLGFTDKHEGLVFHGGEPTTVSVDYLLELRSHFERAKKEILGKDDRQRKFPIVTNGVRLIKDEKYRDEILPHLSQITLSYDPAAQESMRSPGIGFNEYLKLITYLVEEHNLKIGLLMQLSEGNVDKPDEFMDELTQIVDVAGRNLGRTRIQHVHNAYIDISSAQYSPTSIKKFFARAQERFREADAMGKPISERTTYHYLKRGITSWSRCNTYGSICTRSLGGYFLIITYGPRGFSLACPGKNYDNLGSITELQESVKVSENIQELYTEKRNAMCIGCKYKHLCNDCVYEFLGDNIGFYDGVKCKHFFEEAMSWNEA